VPRRPGEEDYLADMHGAEVYADYAARVPRLVPSVAAVATLLPGIGTDLRISQHDLIQ